MGNYLNIIFEHEYQAEDGIDLSIKSVFNTFINHILHDTFPSEFDWFSPWEEGNGSFFGKDDPKRFREVVSSWNVPIDGGLSVASNKLMAEVTNSGEDFPSFVSRNPGSLALWEFKWALEAATNCFHYGQNKLVCYGNCDEWGTRIDQETLEHMLSHPEEYGILEIYYH